MAAGGTKNRFRTIARIGLPTTLLLAAGALALATQRLERAASSIFPLHATVPFDAARAVLPGLASDRVDVAANVPIPFTLQKGETLSDVFASLGLVSVEAQRATRALRPYADPRQLRPGEAYAASFDRDARLTSFELTVTGKGRVALDRDGDDWSSRWRPFRRTVELRSISGQIEDGGSLEAAVVAAGGDSEVTYRMADVLQWDVDFNRDLRVGDHFTVLYQEVYLDGTPDGVGDVLALDFENLGRRLEAYRFGAEGGYYDAEGRPLEKMFLRSPLRYTRITSRFSRHRFHPVLHVYRPHYGVDYHATVGTPVRVTASGVVAFAGWNGGAGRMVKVRHPNGYMTAYLHLSRFASGIRPGRRVQQGQVIAYSGSTGLATAPHLDYRVQHDGRWIDPLSLKSVPADPIPRSDLAQFVARRDALRRMLETGVVPQPVEDEGDTGIAVAQASGAAADARGR